MVIGLVIALTPPTDGLNADDQHDHIRDTVIPAFLHFNLPLLAAGRVAAMVF